MMNEGLKQGLADEYWFRRLSSPDTQPLDLPSTGAGATHSGRTSFSVDLPEELSADIEKLCNGKDQLVHTCLLSALSYMMTRYTDAEKYVLATNLPGMSHDIPNGQAGYFYLLPAIDGMKSFKACLLHMQQVVQEAVANLPFYPERIVAKLKANHKHDQLPGLNKAGIFYADADPSVEQYPFELLFLHQKENRNIRFTIIYNREQYAESLLRQFMRHTIRFLQQGLNNREQPVSTIQFLEPAEEQFLLADLHAAPQPFPANPVYTYIEQQALLAPHQPAIQHGHTMLTYAQVYEEASRFAAWLQSRSLVKESVIGILADRGGDLITAILGIWMAGGAYLPLHPAHPAEKWKQQLNDANVALLVTQKKYLRESNDLLWNTDSLQSLYCMDTVSVADEQERLNESMDRGLWEYIGQRSDDPIRMGGWYSSFTGLPFTPQEMAEYTTNAKEKLLPYLDQEHTRVLEIGCASGLTMYAIAPLVKSYVGIDLSTAAIDYNRRRCEREAITNIRCEVLAAHETDTLQEESFDIIILNSVVQNFHGYNYLKKVIAQCIDSCSPQAVIFIGDIMDAATRQELIAALQAFKAKHTDRDYRTKTDWNDEFFANRFFFEELASAFPMITSVIHSSKVGTIRNELTDYRYDIILHIDKHIPFTAEGQQPRKGQFDRTALPPAAAAGIQNYTPQDLAYIIYTSGSTGGQKGVMIEHAGMLNHLYGKIRDLQIGSDDRIAQTAAQTFDISVWQMFAALITNGQTVVYPDELVIDTHQLMQSVREDRITILEVVPSHLSDMLDILAGHAGVYEFPSLRFLVVTGEMLKPHLVNAWLTHFPSIPIVNAYGPTEASDDITHFITNQLQAGERVPVGRALQNLHIYILDKQGALCAPGVKGEICVSGIGVGRGYLNQPGRTAEAFVTDPFITQHPVRMYKTGDMGIRLPDGNIDCLGRSDTQVKVKGHRIELGDIEYQLQQTTLVREAVVLLLEKENRSPYLHAVLVLQPGFAENEEILRQELGQRIPAYAIPERFSVVESIPLTVHGKTDRKKLAQTIRSEGLRQYKAPATETEQYLAKLWAGILNKPLIGAEDNFFDLGGHSLKATRLVSMIYRDRGIGVELKDVFNLQTVRSLAAKIDQSLRATYEPIRAYASQPHYPVSHAQKRMWVLSQLNDANSAYNIPGAFFLQGNLDIVLLRKAIRAMVERHNLLRTRFITVGEEIRQEIGNIHLFEKIYTELDYSGKPDWKYAAERFIRREATRSFRLSEFPLIRIYLIKGNHDDYCLFYCMHHIISDGWSAAILLREVSAHYTALQKDETSQQEPLQIQYTDYVQWMQEEERQQKNQSSAQWWQQRFSGELPVLDITADHERPRFKSYAGNTIEAILQPGCIQALQTLAKQHNGSLYTTLLASVIALLYRYSRQQDIIIGTVAAGRNHPDLHNQAGLYMNTLPLRFAVNTSLSFSKLVAQTRNSLLEAEQHQQYPFDKLIDDLALTKDLARMPLFDVMVMYESIDTVADNCLQLPGITASPWEEETLVSKFDLTFSFIHSNAGCKLQLNYSTALFSHQRIEQWIADYEALLQAMTADNTLSIDEHVMASPATLPLPVWEQEKRNLPIHELFQQQALRTPAKTAVYFDHLEINYETLYRRSEQLAESLQSTFYIQRGDAVAILLNRCDDLIAVLYAILKIGAVYVPLDTAWPIDRLSFIIADSEAKLLVTQHGFTHLTANLHITSFYLEQLPIASPGYTGAIWYCSDPTDIAYIIYTSGTTGTPKGVCVTQGALANFALSMIKEPGITENDRVLSITSYTFDISILELLVPLTIGGAVAVTQHYVIFSKNAFIQFVERIKPTIIQTTPGMWKILLECNLPGLKQTKCLVGGEKLGVKLGEKMLTACAQVWNMYGPTETTIWSTIQHISTRKHLPFIGRPVRNTAVYILDDNNHAMPVGTFGEIAIGGAGVAAGYKNQEAMTSKKFIDNPFRPGEKLFKTGDVGRWHIDGLLEIKGRKDDMVKIQGYRIELGEIRNAILRFPHVEDAVVIAWPNDLQEFSLTAYVKQKNTFDWNELELSLLTWLPVYMMPAHYIHLDTIPLNTSGKIDRSRLPRPAVMAAATGKPLPATAEEKELAAIWEEVLHRQSIKAADHFFELGGHSVKAIQLLMLVKKKMNWEIPLSDFFENPTIRGMLLLKKRGRYETTLSTIGLAPVSNTYPVSRAQKRLWVLNQMSGASIAYHMPFAFAVSGKANIPVWKAALRRLLDKHEILRTVFRETAGEVQQIIYKTDAWEIPVQQWTAAGMSADTIFHEQAQVDLAKPFDLAAGPLCRLAVCDDPTLDEHKVYINLHHIVCDGLSVELILRDLLQYYHNDAAVYHDQLPIQYKDYVYWQGTRQQELTRQKAYWLEKLSGQLPVVELPLDFNRPLVQTFNGDHICHHFRSGLANELQQLASSTNASLFMVLTAGVKALLHYYTGQTDILLGMPVNGRVHPDLQEQVGLYMNTLVLRTSFEPDDTFTDLLKGVKQTILEAQEHQEYPFDQLIEDLNPERIVNRSSLFDIMVDYYAMEEQQQDGATGIRRIDMPYRTSKFDLSLNFVRYSDDLEVFLEYNTDLFEPRTIQRLASHYEQLLEDILQHPGIRLMELECITEEERSWLLEEVTGLKEQIEPVIALPQQVAAIAAQQPNAPAVTGYNGTMSYEVLVSQACQVTNLLMKKGVGKGDRIGILMRRHEHVIVAILGIMQAGAVCVPVDCQFPPNRIQLYATDSGMKYVLVDNDTVDLPVQLPEACFINIMLQETPLPKSDVSYPVLKAIDTAYILYTSGSTGKPKGVVVSHGALINSAIGWIKEYGLNSFNVRLLSTASISFDVFFGDICRSLLSGGTMVLATDDERLDLHALSRLIETCRINVFETTPALMLPLLDQLYAKTEKPDYLRCIIVGSDTCLYRDYKKMLERFGHHARIINSYGTTEAAIDSTFYESVLHGTGSGVGPIPIGKPFPNVECYILNEHGKLLPQGVEGELYIGGNGLADGYYQDPVMTARRFVQHPFRKGQRLFKTGDRVKWIEGGNILYIGRNDGQIKLRGIRINLEEIEESVKGYEGLEQALATIQANQLGDQLLVLFYTASRELDPLELMHHCSSCLPAHMVPSYFVQIPGLLLGSNGKIDRKLLPSIEEWMPRSTTQVTTQPASWLEEQVMIIWKEILGVGEIGTKDHFFRMGGHSLKAIQTVFRITDTLGYKLHMKDIFTYPTIEKLCYYLTKTSPVTSVPLQRCAEKEYYRLSGAQLRFWLENQMAGKKEMYHIDAAYTLEGALNTTALASAWQNIIDRHEPLRTAISLINGEPFQRILSGEENIFKLDISDISAERDKGLLITDLVLTHSTTPFDLENGPLVRASLVRTAQDQYLFLFNMHHIISDEWSVNILMQDLQLCYEAALKQIPHGLQQPGISYRDFAEWQWNTQTTQEYNKQRSYWMSQFDQQTPVLQLPVDYERGKRLSQETSNLDTIDAGTSTAIIDFCREQGITLYTFLFSCYTILMAKVSATSDLLIGTISTGRSHPSTEPLIGAFVNTIPLRLRYDEQQSFMQFLHHTRDLLLESLSNQDYPFEEIIKMLRSHNKQLPANPLPVLFEMNQIDNDFSLLDIKVTPFDIGIPKSTHFEVLLTVLQQQDTILCNWTYDNALFSPHTIRQMQQWYLAVIRAALENTGQQLGGIEIRQTRSQHQHSLPNIEFDF